MKTMNKLDTAVIKAIGADKAWKSDIFRTVNRNRKLPFSSNQINHSLQRLRRNGLIDYSEYFGWSTR